MYQDKLLMFSEAQAITVTARSTNVIDLLAAAADIGTGEQLYVAITVSVSFTAAGAATLTITLETDDNGAFSSAAVVATSTAIGKASLVANMDPIYIPIPPSGSNAVNWERYFSLNYTVATGPMTAGTLTAGVVHGIQKSKAYPSNFVSA